MAMANERPAEHWADKLARLASLGIVATAASAALAFYLGWRYERAYVEEWGLTFSSFSYAPYDLMVASSLTLLWVAVGVTTFVGTVWGDQFMTALFGPAPPIQGKPLFPRWVYLAGLYLIIIGGAAVMVAIALIEGLYGFLSIGWVVAGSIGGSAYKRAQRGSPRARVFLIGLALIVGWTLVVAGPAAAWT